MLSVCLSLAAVTIAWALIACTQGMPTANVNWCEEDYAVTEYVAEFYNTVSSLMTYCVIGGYGISCYAGDAATRLVAAGYATLLLIGLGSASFHGTLWRSMQLLDELPMLYLIANYLVLSFQLELGAWLVLAGCTAICAIAIRFPEYYEVFSVFFGIGVTPSPLLACWLPSPLLACWLPSPLLAPSLLCSHRCGGWAGVAICVIHGGFQHSTHLRAHPHIQRFAEYAIIGFALGGLGWGIEIVACEHVRFLHMHSTAWHTGSSLAAHFALQFYLGTSMLNRPELQVTEHNVLGLVPFGQVRSNAYTKTKMFKKPYSPASSPSKAKY